MEFATFIRNRRLELGKTQRQVADYIGVRCPDFLCLVEQGRRRLELERIPLLAHVLETDARTLCRLALESRAPRFCAQLLGHSSSQEHAA